MLSPPSWQMRSCRYCAALWLRYATSSDVDRIWASLPLKGLASHLSPRGSLRCSAATRATLSSYFSTSRGMSLEAGVNVTEGITTFRRSVRGFAHKYHRIPLRSSCKVNSI